MMTVRPALRQASVVRQASTMPAVGAVRQASPVRQASTIPAVGARQRARASWRARARRHQPALIGLGLITTGAGLVPWLYVLAVTLPARPVAWHWPAAWVGLDAMEATGLISTGLLLWRGDGRYRLTAAATAALLATDAWFDVLTAPPGAGRVTSVLMAVCAEVPAATACAWLAVHEPGSDGRNR